MVSQKHDKLCHWKEYYSDLYAEPTRPLTVLLRPPTEEKESYEGSESFEERQGPKVVYFVG